MSLWVCRHSRGQSEQGWFPWRLLGWCQWAEAEMPVAGGRGKYKQRGGQCPDSSKMEWHPWLGNSEDHWAARAGGRGHTGRKDRSRHRSSMCRVVEEERDLLEYSLWELPLLLTWAKSIQWNTHCYSVWVGTTHIVSFPGPIEAFVWFTRKDIETPWTWVSYPGWHRCGHWEGNSDLCSFLELRKEIWIWIVFVLMDYKLNEGYCVCLSPEKNWA